MGERIGLNKSLIFAFVFICLFYICGCNNDESSTSDVYKTDIIIYDERINDTGFDDIINDKDVGDVNIDDLLDAINDTLIYDILDIQIVDTFVDAGDVNEFEFVMGSDYYEPVETAIPEKGARFIDPNFHTSIFRITDKNIDKYSGEGIQNEYSRSDPENIDGTYIILRGNDGEWYLYNLSNFSVLKKLEGINGGGQEPEPRWDNQSPNKFYYLYGTELRLYDVQSDKFEVVHNFTKEYPDAVYISTGTEGDASLDRRYWCLMLFDDSYSLLGVTLYDRNQNKINGYLSASSLPQGIGINWVSMDMSGKNCLIGFEDDGAGYTPPVGVYDLQLKYRHSLPDGANGHMDLALLSDNRDVMVYQNNRTDWIAMSDINTGEETNLIQIPFDVNADIGLHFSGNNGKIPGWVLVSTYGSKNPPAGNKHSWMDNQLFLLELKSNPRILRIAHTHSYTSLNYEGEKNYFAESFAAINSSGTAIYFGSNWNIYKMDYSDAYVVRLPENWTALLK